MSARRREVAPSAFWAPALFCPGYACAWLRLQTARAAFQCNPQCKGGFPVQKQQQERRRYLRDGGDGDGDVCLLTQGCVSDQSLLVAFAAVAARCLGAQRNLILGTLRRRGYTSCTGDASGLRKISERRASQHVHNLFYRAYKLIAHY